MCRKLCDDTDTFEHPANFRKNLKWSEWNTQGPEGKYFMIKKPKVENFVSDSL